ncbi:hypothetical protein BD560DRAFT_413821, partial [Blakeslea trispora]
LLLIFFFFLCLHVVAHAYMCAPSQMKLPHLFESFSRQTFYAVCFLPLLFLTLVYTGDE